MLHNPKNHISLLKSKEAAIPITPTGFTGKIPYNAVLTSSGGISLNTSTSLITVPITGLYQINACKIQLNRTFVYWAVVDDNSGSPQVHSRC